MIGDIVERSTALDGPREDRSHDREHVAHPVLQLALEHGRTLLGGAAMRLGLFEVTARTLQLRTEGPGFGVIIGPWRLSLRIPPAIFLHRRVPLDERQQRTKPEDDASAPETPSVLLPHAGPGRNQLRMDAFFHAA
jgi:hypothetical protein